LGLIDAQASRQSRFATGPEGTRAAYGRRGRSPRQRRAQER